MRCIESSEIIAAGTGDELTLKTRQSVAAKTAGGFGRRLRSAIAAQHTVDWRGPVNRTNAGARPGV